MAMIERIRQRRGLLIFFIGIGMLGFLIPYDAVMGLFGRTPGSQSIGELNGSTMSQAQWQDELTKVQDTRLYAGGAKDVESAAWSDLVNTSLYSPEYDAAGYAIGDEEYDNLRFGVRPSAMVTQAYYRGTVSEESREVARNLFEQQTGLTEIRQKEMIIKRYKLEKLESLLKKGFYANSLDAERDHLLKNDKAKVNFVAIKYDAISDSLVDVSDQQVRSYFNKNKMDVKYRQNPFRTVSYVTYDVVASAQDSSDLKNQLQVVKEKFSMAENDSIFIIKNSNNRSYLEEVYSPGTVAGAADTQLIEGEVGTIVGPYKDKDTYKMSKIIRKDPVVEEVSGRHIFLEAGFREKDSIRVIADSLKQLLIDGASFSALASKWSADDTTATSGGSLGTFTVDDEIDPSKSAQNALRNLLLSSKQGEPGIADIPGGISIYEATSVTYNGEESVLAVLSRAIQPSKATKDEMYKKVRTFSLDNPTAEQFLAAADEEGISVNPQKLFPTSRSVGSIQNSGDIVNWAFARDTDLGAVSNVFDINSQYIVAAVTLVQDDIVPGFDTVEEDVRADAIKQAKYEMVKDQMSTGTLDEIVANVDGAEKKTVTLSFNTTNVVGLGNNEPVAVGKAFGAPEGTIVNPIKGDAGVVVLERESMTLAELKTSYPDEQSTLQTAYSGKYNRIKTSLTRLLIKDERNR